MRVCVGDTLPGATEGKGKEGWMDVIREGLQVYSSFHPRISLCVCLCVRQTLPHCAKWVICFLIFAALCAGVCVFVCALTVCVNLLPTTAAFVTRWHRKCAYFVCEVCGSAK